METLGRWFIGVVAALWLAGAAEAAAECLAAPVLDEPRSVSAAEALGLTPEAAANGDARRDMIGRVVAPVMINGQGPFRFIVDTGANRTVLSTELAARLNLASVGESDVHSIDSVLPAELAQVDAVNYGRLTLSSGRLPILSSPRVLAGEAGILGVDGMEGRRLRLDFDRRCIEIVSSRRAAHLDGSWVTIRGTLRFGHLVMLRARVRDVAINVLIDTGSNGSLGNIALRNALRSVQVAREDFNPSTFATAGRPVVADQFVVIPRLTMGSLNINNVIAYVGDYHVFSLWGLEHEPTLLIGMDVIGRTKAIAIDYERATVHFKLPRTVDVY